MREAAIEILGRLTPLNPAHVMPALRRMLVQVTYADVTYAMLAYAESCARHARASPHVLAGALCADVC